MSQLRTLSARRAARRLTAINGQSFRSATHLLLNSKLSQILPLKEILRQLRKLRLIVR